MSIFAACFASILLQPHQDAKFLVPWKPEADARYHAIRAKIEPYSYRSNVDVGWMRKQTAEAYAEWQQKPKDPTALFRVHQWQQALLAAHYNADREEDQRARTKIEGAVQKLEQIPRSAEFARMVCSALYGTTPLKTLSLRLLKRYPDDGLLLFRIQPNFLGLVPQASLQHIKKLANHSLAERPQYWPARYTWAVVAWTLREEATILEALDAMKEMRRRFLSLKADPSLGQEEAKDVEFWLERLSRYIPAHEKLVREGKGNVKLKGYRGDPP